MIPMCGCGEVLAEHYVQHELATMRQDRYKIALGKGKDVKIYGVVFVADDRGGREVSLSCCQCGARWNLKFGREVRVALAQ